MEKVERRSQREIHRLTGIHRDTIRRALAADAAELRAAAEAPLEARSLRWGDRATARPGADALGRPHPRGDRRARLCGGKTILDDLLRELRPRYLPPPRTYQRTVYRPGELAQFDLTEPRREIPVGWGQLRRGYLVTCELPYSRAFAGALVFSKEFADIAWGMSRCLDEARALPEKLVWDREGAIHAGAVGRPSRSSPSAASSRWAGSSSTPATARPRGRSSAPPLRSRQLRGRPVLRQPGRLPGPARPLVRSDQRAQAPQHAGDRLRAPRRRARANAAAARGDALNRPALGPAGRAPALPALRPQRLLARSALGRPEGRGPRLPAEVIAVALDSGELAARHRRVFAGGLTFTDPAHQPALEELRGERRRGRRARGRGPAAGPLRRADPGMSKTSELAHLFRTLKAPAAARALPKLADRAREEEWSLRALRRGGALDRGRLERVPRRREPDQGGALPGPKDARGVRLHLPALGQAPGRRAPRPARLPARARRTSSCWARPVLVHTALLAVVIVQTVQRRWRIPES